MGRRVACLLAHHESLVLAAALERPGVILEPTALGLAAGHDVLITTDAATALANARVVIDFAAPAAVVELAGRCAASGAGYLVAATDLTSQDEAALVHAAKRTAVLRAANLSVGVNVLLELVEVAARRLGPGFDIEIGEIHHRHKRDAPSGTALALGEAAVRGHGALRSVLGRSGQGAPRGSDELGFAALRGGEVAGEHTVYFFGEAERLELVHRASNPDIFAYGALWAASFLVNRAPGLYGMRDVLAAR